MELTTNHIRALRTNTTDAEKHLWYFLRARRLKGFKFRRQHLIYPYIVDFVCIEKKLIIELDGGQHAENFSYDEKRSLFLKSKGYRVIRFWNTEVFTETEGVLMLILRALQDKSPSP
jgi:very-short-patch-repair endonuclease